MKRIKLRFPSGTMARRYERGIQVTGSSSGSSSGASDMNENDYLKAAEEYIREHGFAPPRPPHLKGRAIGLWHSKMGRLRKSLLGNGPTQKVIRPVSDVKLTKSQKTEIKAVLNNLPDKICQTSSSQSSYENMQDSRFKREFLQNIYGKMEDNIDESMEYQQDSHIDEKLYNELQSKYENQKFTKMLKKRNVLPSSRVKEKIINMVNSNQVTLISGETGCGKTTQVPQFLLDHFIENKKGSMCKIVCTQPRRISAISVAERVAAERAEALGHSTGYQIRLEKKLPRNRGSVTFCTTGVVLRQMQCDSCLSEYTHIIIDEIHERDIQTDFLITLLKQVITRREDLRVILMSATLNAESFSNYFDQCPHLNIPGFTYHVEEYFLEDIIQRTRFEFDETGKYKSDHKKKPMLEKEMQFNSMIQTYIKKLRKENKYDEEIFKQLSNPISEVLNLNLVLSLLTDICYKEKELGAILVFVPGFTDISELHKYIESSGHFPHNKFWIIPLHSQMPTVEQKQVFDTPPPGVRKIVISTNIAETSITIDDVVFVIDCGRIKINYFDVETNTETLEARWVSKANASQRKGRAGRVRPGVCFHMFTRARYQTLEPYILPEILRTRLENVILTAKILQLGKVEDFFSRLMDSPDPNIVSASLELLKRLEALDENESLTPLGYHLAKLPMHPQIGKMLLFGALFNCLEPILNIAVTLDYRDPFLIPLGKEKESDRKRKEFSGICQSDHILSDKLIQTFETLNDFQQRKFCWEYFLSWPTMRQLLKLKKDFMDNLYEMRFVPSKDPKCGECNSNSDKLDLVRAVICAGLYPNVVTVRTKGRKKQYNLLYLLSGKKVSFHPKSILNGELLTSPLLVYYKMIKSRDIYIHDATPVDPFHVIFFGDNFQQITDNDVHFITINNSLKFRSAPSTSNVIRELRDKLNNCLEYKISHPNVVDLRKENEETDLFRTIIELLHSDQMAQYEANTFGNQETNDEK